MKRRNYYLAGAALLVAALVGMVAFRSIQPGGGFPVLVYGPGNASQWFRNFVVDGKVLEADRVEMARAADGSFWILWYDRKDQELCLSRSDDLVEWHGRIVVGGALPEARLPGAYRLAEFSLSGAPDGAVVATYRVVNRPGVGIVIHFYRRSQQGVEEHHEVTGAFLVREKAERWDYYFCCGAKNEYLLATRVWAGRGSWGQEARLWRSSDLENWQPVGTIPRGISSLFYFPGAKQPHAGVVNEADFESILVSANGKDWALKSPPEWKRGVRPDTLSSDGKGNYWVFVPREGAGNGNALWVARSADLENWSELLLTPVQAGTRVVGAFSGAFVIASPGTSDPEGPVPARFLVFTETDLRLDSDNDGLTDVQEYRMMTNPLVADTDGDGTPDGKDLNPLAAPHPLTTVQQIRQAVMEKMVSKWDTEVGMFGCRGPKDRQEFAGLKPVVLCLTPQEESEYDRRFGTWGMWRWYVSDVDIHWLSGTATVRFQTFYNGLSAQWWSVNLKKVKGRWRVTSTKMKSIA